MMKVAVKNLQKKIPINPKKVIKAVLKTLSLEEIKESGEITVCFLNNNQIRELNLMYLGQYTPTDVISFCILRSKKEIIADIAVSTDMAVYNARIFKTTPSYELYLYVIHGILHLLGYDDRNAKQKKLMQDKASQILTALNKNHVYT